MGSLLLGTLIGSSALFTSAQVATTITASGLGTTVTSVLENNVRTETITGGARPGNGPNLFHSFGRFTVGRTTGTDSIVRNDIANFFNETGLPTTNILSRVTEGFPSEIHGTLQTANFGGASLWLINPAGVIFGPTASLNIGGSLNIATADYLRLTDGVRFNAVAGPADALLSVAPVAAFGFTTPRPVAISIQGGNTLQVASGQTLSIIGGDVTLSGVPGFLSLYAPDGQVHIVSVASAGEVVKSALGPPANLNVDSFAQLGKVELSGSANISVDGDPGGTVMIRGGQVRIDNSNITARTGNLNGAEVGIAIQADESIVVAGGFMDNFTLGTGKAGKILFESKNVTINESPIATGSVGPGAGGTVEVNAEQLTLSGFRGLLAAQSQGTFPGAGPGGEIVVHAKNVTAQGGGRMSGVTFGPGAGGTIQVTATEAVMLTGGAAEGPSGLLARARGTEPGAGKGGDIVVQAKNLTVEGGAQISSTSSGPGGGGSIQVTATEAVTLTGTRPDGRFSSGLFANAEGTGPGAGNAGDLVVQAKNLTVKGGALISSTSFGPGAGGTIQVRKTEAVTLTGTRPDGLSSGLFANALGTELGAGDAGSIFVEARSVTVEGGAKVETSTLGPGNASSITANVGALSLSGNAVIASSSLGSATGNAGSVTIQGLISSADSVTLTDSLLLTSAAHTGRGGNIKVEATTLTLNNAAISASVKDVLAGGDPTKGVGNIMLTASQETTLSNGTLISADSAGTRNAGTVTIHAGQNFFVTESQVTTEALNTSGGNINIFANQKIRLTNSGVTTSVFGPEGTVGGDIFIDPQFVILQHSDILAQAFGGRGGNINILAGTFLADPNSLVSASSQVGVSGSVNIRAPIQNLSGTLVPLRQAYVNVALAGDRCAASPTGQFSSFVQVGRDGIPPEPGSFAASPLWLEEDAGASEQGALPVPSFMARRLGLTEQLLETPTPFVFSMGCGS